MFHLLEPSDRRAPRWVAVGEKAPAAGQPLGVLRISAEYPHPQWTPVHVMPDVNCRADPLSLRDPQVLGLDAKRCQRSRHTLESGHACCGSEREPNERARREAEREAGQGPGRSGSPQRNDADGGERDEPGRRRSDGSDELGPRDNEDSDHEREP
jgi:hypothetical protein